MGSLVRNLIEKGYLRDHRLVAAFSTIEREEFIPDLLSHNANADIALPIGYGQTIPQPTSVAFALELLQVERGNNVLDVGSGSGWVTGILAYMVGRKGCVTGLEIIPDLYAFGKDNIEKFNLLRERRHIELYEGDGLSGYEKNAPYDRIFVGIDVPAVPNPLKEQLAVGGKMILSLRGSVCLGVKDSSGLVFEEYRGFSFTPSVKKNEWK